MRFGGQVRGALWHNRHMGCGVFFTVEGVHACVFRDKREAL